MKKLFSILLLIAFLVQSTSQLWILISFKINQEYIAANLCINRFDAIPVCKGSCYLEKKINQDQEQQQKLPDLKLKETNLFCQENNTEYVLQNAVTNCHLIYPSYKVSFVSSAYIRSVFRPPSSIV